MIGAFLAVVAAIGLYANMKHQITGRRATATLMQHINQCTVEYQRVGEQKTKEQSPCDEAEEFQRRIGPNKVKVSYHPIARVRFRLEDGRTHEANVAETSLGSSKLAIGATLPVVYARDNPNDVRAPLTWEGIKPWLSVIGIGLGCLVLTRIGRLTALFGGASRDRASPAWEKRLSESSRHLRRH
jgi:hypothetical protein